MRSFSTDALTISAGVGKASAAASSPTNSLTKRSKIVLAALPASCWYTIVLHRLWNSDKGRSPSDCVRGAFTETCQANTQGAHIAYTKVLGDRVHVQQQAERDVVALELRHRGRMRVLCHG